VSCGGNILINVGPSKEGTIIPIFQERLKQLGTWLKANGEAIYATVPWVHQNDTLPTDTPVWYTAGKGNFSGYVYALVIGWPKNDVLTLKSATADPGLTKIALIGFEEELIYEQTEIGLRIQFPRMSQVLEQCGSGCQWIYALKMEKVKPANSKQQEDELVQISTIK
jgi:alpha-L-fucosidase